MKTLQKHSSVVFQLIVLLLFTGCSQSFIVTKQGERFSNDNISFDQFNRLRGGKYFEMVLKDSSVVLITLIRTDSDSIVYETGEEPVQYSLPIESVTMLTFHQNDNGINAMIGGFGGLLIGGGAAKSFFDFNDSKSSIKGFATVVTCTVVGALIGYNSKTAITYYFPPQKKKKS
jgi:hypothetical protein